MKSFRTKITACNGYRVAGIVLITLFVASCQSGAPSGQRIQSGGLGLSRTEWERQHGPIASQDSGYDYYDDPRGRFMVNFLAGRAISIKRSYGDPAGVTLEEARSQSKELIPADSRLVRTYNASAGPVDLYFSDTLKRIFPSDDNYWIRGEPGNFIFLYFSNHDVVDSFVIGLGNNP